MKIVPIASDSMGTRSMATYVETRDVKIFIDPGVALGPSRYGLPPHPLELQRLDEHWAEIVEYARRSEVLIVTHYHYDHHSPWEDLDIYQGKTVFVKHPTEKINRSQRERAAFFLEQIKGKPEKLEYCDGKEVSFGNTLLRFSSPVFHGTNPRLGYVVEVLVDDGGERFLFTSDVEGPSVREQAQFVLENQPNILYVDGPMSYMLGYRYSQQSLQESIKNLTQIVKACPLKTLILDHHLLRDLEWKARMQRVLEEAKRRGVKALTAADYAGKPLEMLEARRKELYQKQPPKGEVKARKAIGGD
ncbi:MAG: hypothetical protein DRO52_05945 [Candidatus Hecatellales archaeon]|nr:MAG: hypothetical protein DRO52_05945 [Candidatus Hecatellales archaeon]